MILNKRVGVALNLVHNRFKQYMTVTFQKKGYNLTPEQFLVMDALWDNGTLSQQQIADTILKDKNSVVKLIDGLEKKQWVNRAAHKQDRRLNLIETTPLAAQVRQEVTDLAMEAVTLITRDIPDGELRTFLSVLSRMAANMDDNNLLKIADYGQTV